MQLELSLILRLFPGQTHFFFLGKSLGKRLARARSLSCDHSFCHCRGEKKVICNKIILQSAVTSLVWPPQQPSFVFGLADGKVSPYALIFIQSVRLTYSLFLCAGSDGWSQGKQIPDNLCHRFLRCLPSNEVLADRNSAVIVPFPGLQVMGWERG